MKTVFRNSSFFLILSTSLFISTIPLIGNAGESSCYLLAKQSGVIITSDTRAYKKLMKNGVSALKIETFFIQMYLKERINKEEILEILDKLEQIWAITSKQKLLLKLKIEKGNRENE